MPNRRRTNTRYNSTRVDTSAAADPIYIKKKREPYPQNDYHCFFPSRYYFYYYSYSICSGENSVSDRIDRTRVTYYYEPLLCGREFFSYGFSSSTCTVRTYVSRNDLLIEKTLFRTQYHFIVYVITYYIRSTTIHDVVYNLTSYYYNCLCPSRGRDATTTTTTTLYSETSSPVARTHRGLKINSCPTTLVNRAFCR